MYKKFVNWLLKREAKWLLYDSIMESDYPLSRDALVNVFEAMALDCASGESETQNKMLGIAISSLKYLDIESPVLKAAVGIEGHLIH